MRTSPIVTSTVGPRSYALRSTEKLKKETKSIAKLLVGAIGVSLLFVLILNVISNRIINDDLIQEVIAGAWGIPAVERHFEEYDIRELHQVGGSVRFDRSAGMLAFTPTNRITFHRFEMDFTRENETVRIIEVRGYDKTWNSKILYEQKKGIH